MDNLWDLKNLKLLTKNSTFLNDPRQFNETRIATKRQLWEFIERL
jgi:hypothetical protein